MVVIMCGVLGIYTSPQYLINLEALLPLLQLLAHRGQDASGILYLPSTIQTYGLPEVQIIKNKGLPLDIKLPQNKKTHIAIGSTRYPTFGKKSDESTVDAFAQPFSRYTPWGPLALVHNGNITYAPDTGIVDANYCSDAEIITELLTQILMHSTNGNLENAIKILMENIDGAYSICGIYTNKLFAFRDPNAIRPLCFGYDENSVIVSSESLVLDQYGIPKIRDVKPGELLIFDAEG